MSTKPSLFSSYDPLEESVELFRQVADENKETLFSLRTVSIVKDLIVIYEWLNSPLRKMNWPFDAKRMTTLQHYKQILLSENAQSLMIEENGEAVLQMDIMHLHSAGYPARAGYHRMDYALNYLYRESFRSPDIFKNSLSFVIPFLFSHAGIRSLYVKLPKPENALEDLLLENGFEPAGLHNIFGKSLPIYKISRAI